MRAAIFGYLKDLPEEFYHDAYIQDNDGWTVAMHAAEDGCIEDLPREFYHDPTFKNNDH